MNSESHMFIRIGILVILLVAFNFVPNIIQAQSHDFRIQDYIPEKFRDTQLRLSTDLSFNGSEDDYVNLDLTKIARANHDQDINLAAFFRYRFETVQRFLIASLNVDGNRRKSSWDYNYKLDDFIYARNIQDEEKITENSFLFNPSFGMGIYLNNTFFISSILSLSYKYDDQPDYGYLSRISTIDNSDIIVVNLIVEESSIEHIQDQNTYTLDFQLSPGFGHVYDGKYNSTAIYIINELRSNNLLNKEPSIEQMISLSELLYQAGKKHYFDFRLHDIETVEKISEFLLTRGIISASNAKSTLLINDVWNYFPLYSRQFGFRCKAGFGIEYEHQSSENKNLQEYYNFEADFLNNDVVDTLLLETNTYRRKYLTENKSTYPYFIIQFEYFNPIDHKWQLDFSIDAKYYLNSSPYELDETYVFEPSDSYRYIKTEFEFRNTFDINIFGNFLYILNSRTSANLSGRLGYYHLDHKREYYGRLPSGGPIYNTINEYDDLNKFNYFAGLSLDYRISIPITWTISVSYNSGVPLYAIKGNYGNWDRDEYTISTYFNYNLM